MAAEKPTVAAVTVKYKASVRVSGSVKFAAEARSIRKYVEANRTRKNGMIKASGPAARTG
jgi:hypothetical protein